MVAKRRRQQGNDEEAKSAHKVHVSTAHGFQSPSQNAEPHGNMFEQRPQTASGIGQFFESPAVRAWYSGDSNEVVSANRIGSCANPLTTPDTQCYPPDVLQVKNRLHSCSSISNSSCAGPLSNEVENDGVTATSVYSEPELSTFDQKLEFVVPSSERLNTIKARAIEAMSVASEDLKPCCVCEMAYEKDEILMTELTEKSIERMRKCLQASNCVPAIILSQYNASHLDQRLKGLLLFPPAIYNKHGITSAHICKSCYDSIQCGKSASLPKNAIANGNYIGHIPLRFQALTRTDEQAVSLVLPCVSLSIVTGGVCRTIKSHHYIVRNTEGPIVDMLPRSLESRVRVTMVGHMTKDQVIACKKRYELNLPLCRKFLKFLYLHNSEYKDYGATRNGSKASATNLTETESNSARGVVIDHTSESGEDVRTADLIDRLRDKSTYSNFGSSEELAADTSTERTWISASSVLMSPTPSIDVVVRKSNAYVPSAKWATCVRMFPTLFPAGCGGPTQSRLKYLSVRHWILRCLRLYDHRFETHYAFMLLAFDYLATENARKTLYIRLNVKREAIRAAEVKSSTILEAVKYYKYLTICRAKGVKPNPPIDEVQNIIDLRKGLRVPESAFYGSNISRMRARFDLFGMLKRFGPLQVFFTISPDSAGTYNIAVKAGKVSRTTIDEANAVLMPTRGERKQIAASYPVECARYFLRVVKTVIEILIGWDQELNAPKKGGGIFGVVRAFGGSAETQLAGDLHAHFAIWLHGFPTTAEGFAISIENDASFYTRFLSLVDSVLVAKPPSLVNEVQCVNCQAANSVTAIIPGVDAYRRPAAGAQPPITSICKTCSASFKDKDIIDASLTSYVEGENDLTNAKWNDFEKCRPPSERLNNTYVISLLVRELQFHYWNHCKSCFKKTIRTPKGSICRFLKPEAVNLVETMIDEHKQLRIHRPIGCEYINPYNPVVMASMKCNHDAQFVLSNGSKDAAAYVAKYCFKSQNPVENQVALSLAAFTRAAGKTNSLPPDTSLLEKGYKMLGSMLYTVTNGQEVAAPMAALYILNKSPFWFSHEFVRVDLWRILSKRGDSVEISVSQREIEAHQLTRGNGSISSLNLLEKYWERPPQLESVPFIDILERYEYKKRKPPSSAPNSSLEHVSFVRLKSPKVLVVCGKEIPDISGHLDRESFNFYYLSILALFKPHRASTLCPPDQSPLCEYRVYIANGDAGTVIRMQNFEQQLQDYFRAQNSDSAKNESKEDEILRTRLPATAFSVDSRPERDSSTGHELLGEDIPDDFIDVMDFIAPDVSTRKLADDANNVVNAVPSLKESIQEASRRYKSLRSTNTVSIDSRVDLDAYALLIKASFSGTTQSDSFGTCCFLTKFRLAATRLERLRECFEPVVFVSPTGSPRWTRNTLPSFPRISMVSEAFQLNFWQHAAFEVAARHLLFAYSKDISDALTEPIFPLQDQHDPYDRRDQLIGYLGGEAGTGKSTVVEALLTFACKWGREGSVETLAFTGVAAINIKGRTMHSARNLKLSGAEPNAPPTIEMKAHYMRVVLVIIDEISITDQSLLGAADAVSRSMTSTPEKIMGGKHIFLIGDLLQLPPVAGSPCFLPPPSHASRQRHIGYSLYAAINVVVFLTKNMRARFDNEYIAILAALRWGRLSDSQLEKLNSRVQSTNLRECCFSSSNDFLYQPVVVCLNKLRCAINNAMIFRIAEASKCAVFECLAVPSSRSKLIVENLLNVNDNLTDRIPMRLLFYVGMPIMLTHKHPDLREADVIANGVIGSVVGSHPPLEDLPQLAYEVSGVIVHKLLRLPLLLLIRLYGVDSVLVEGFPEGVIGLPPLHGSIRLNKIPNLAQSSVTVTQFAVVPAFACTTEKLQGQTCYDGIVVTPLDRRRSVPGQTLYVALSRAVCLQGLTLTESITRRYLNQFKPSEAIAREMQRLINLVVLPPYISSDETEEFDSWRATQHL